MVRLTYARKNPLQEILNRLDVLESAPPGGVTSAFGRTGAVVGATNDYNWAQIDKTTSSLADLATKSAGALTSGTLDNARLDTELQALAGLTSAANKVPYFTGSGTAGVLDFKDEDNMASNSDTAVPSQQSVKAYADSLVVGLFDFKGSTDCSSNPNYPSASKGDAYVVSVAGKIGGASGKSVDVGDVYMATADNAGGTEASVGTSWTVLEHNLTGALLAANNLSDVASASTARTNLGLAIGTDVQAYDAELAALAGLTSAADKGIQFTGSGTAATFDLTAAGKALLDDANATAQIATLGLDADIATLSLPASTTISTFGASLVDDANAAAAIATLGLDADIATLALPASTTISAFGASLIDDAAASNARTTLGLGTIATEAETGYALLAGRSGGQTLYGGTGSGDDLLLRSTSNATEGYILGQADDLWGIGGVTSPVSGNFATFSDVASPTRTGTTKGITVAAATDPTLTAKNTATGAELAVGGFGSGGLGIGSVSSTNLAFYRGGTEMLTLSSAGLGLRTNDPKSGIDLRDSLSLKQVTDSTTSYAALDTDAIILMTNVAARAVTLPAASTRTGRIYLIVDGAGTATTAPITLDPNSTELINGASTFNIDKNYGAAFIYCDGTGWRVISAPGTFGGGTVTSITAGTGLSGGTITGSGTIAIDSTVTTLTGSQVLTNKTLTSPLLQGQMDGWIAANETWTYASATTFTIAGVDRTGTLNVGDKIKLTQTSVKYFYITGVSFSTNTTVTVNGGSDYSLANAAITSPYYSKDESPNGFPDAFNFTPTYTGTTAAQTGMHQLSMKGRMVTLWVNRTNNPTSNSTAFTMNLPITPAATVTDGGWIGYGGGANNGVASATQYKVKILTAGTVANFYRDFTDLAWTNSGAKGIDFTVTYKV